VIDRAEKIGVLERACGKSMSELVFSFVTLLVRKRRENLIATIARQMHALVDDDKGTVTAMIATPTKLGDADVADLARRLSNVYRRTIVPEQKVDPDLLGGAVVQVGDRYVDASVAGKLESIRRHLLETVDAAGTTSPNGKGS
jgi:F-type H+-transporting ATPase subunit delta